MYAIYLGLYLDHSQACQHKNIMKEVLTKWSFSKGNPVLSHYFLIILQHNKKYKLKIIRPKYFFKKLYKKIFFLNFTSSCVVVNVRTITLL
jgi:hypothetical protein